MADRVIEIMLAGQETISGLLAVLMGDWDELAGKIQNAHGAAEEMAKIQLDNLSGDLKILGSAWDAFQQSLFEDQAGAGLRGFVKTLTEIVGRVNKLFSDVNSPLVDKLKAAGIERLERVILTHPHADHIGGIKSVLDNFNVDLIYDNGQSSRSSLWKSYHSAGVPCKKLIAGDFSILFTGDIDSAVEDELIQLYDLRATVLKAAHHGSRSSSSADFIANVNPQFVLISAGDKFNHPHKQTLATLRENFILPENIFCTRFNGDV